jgi:shikimate dehydrogenase
MRTDIDTATKLVGLFGHPVGHSLSPLFMNRAMRRLGLNACYLAFDLENEEVGSAVLALRVLRFIGTNVTIPHKSRVIPYLDRTEEDAERIGAVNCIYRENETLVGANTDHTGFIKPLLKRGISLKGEEAVLFGCGGAARAVVYALLCEGVSRLYIVNRTRETAEGLMRWAGDRFPESSCSYVGTKESLPDEVAGKARLIVNTTPLGMLPNDKICPLPESVEIREDQVVYDLVYNPQKTVLLQKAHRNGASFLNGLEMLVSQGVFSLVRWFPHKKEEILMMEDDLLAFLQRRLY